MSTTTMDALGRVLIRGEIREALNVAQGVQFDVSIKDGAIVLRPMEKVCAICKSSIQGDAEIPLCDACVSRVKNM